MGRIPIFADSHVAAHRSWSFARHAQPLFHTCVWSRLQTRGQLPLFSFHVWFISRSARIQMWPQDELPDGSNHAKPHTYTALVISTARFSVSSRYPACKRALRLHSQVHQQFPRGAPAYEMLAAFRLHGTKSTSTASESSHGTPRAHGKARKGFKKWNSEHEADCTQEDAF